MTVLPVTKFPEGKTYVLIFREGNSVNNVKLFLLR